MNSKVTYKLKLVLCLLSVIVLTSCNYTNLKASEGFDASNASAKSGLDFLTVQKAIFTPACIECHRQYSSYKSVARELSQIRTSVLNNRMPRRGPPLSDDLKALLTVWIDAGAPETASTLPPDAPIDAPIEPNWTSLSTGLIFPKCLVCHNPQGQAKFLDLSSRQVIFENRNRIFSGDSKLIDIENAKQSYLIQILRDDDEPMPPKKSGIARPTAFEIETVVEWIRNGLP